MSDPMPPAASYLQHLVEMFKRTSSVGVTITEGEDYAPSPENDAPWNVINSIELIPAPGPAYAFQKRSTW